MKGSGFQVFAEPWMSLLNPSKPVSSERAIRCGRSKSIQQGFGKLERLIGVGQNVKLRGQACEQPRLVAVPVGTIAETLPPSTARQFGCDRPMTIA
jgi:hypothetical protein